MKKAAHPYHYSENKSIIQRLIDFGVPLGLFWFYFQFYNFGQFNPKEMVKTTGLLAIVLLSLTLAIGPLCRFFPALDILKAHRKIWGILSFIFAFLHMSLIFIYFYKFNFLKFVDFSNPKYLGILAGLLALFVLFIVSLTSHYKFINSLTPKTWKIIQTTGYLALILAILHFYLVESQNGVLVIKKVVGQLTFGFAAAVIAVRLLVSFFPGKK